MEVLIFASFIMSLLNFGLILFILDDVYLLKNAFVKLVKRLKEKK